MFYLNILMLFKMLLSFPVSAYGYLWQNFHSSMLVYSYCWLTRPQVIKQLQIIYGKTLIFKWMTVKTMKNFLFKTFAMHDNYFDNELHMVFHYYCLYIFGMKIKVCNYILKTVFLTLHENIHNYLACQRKVLYIHWSCMTSECLGPASKWSLPRREEKSTVSKQQCIP